MLAGRRGPQLRVESRAGIKDRAKLEAAFAALQPFR
jgi:hypothetical protein